MNDRTDCWTYYGQTWTYNGRARLLKIQSQNENLITANSHHLHYLKKVNGLTLL